jgi:lipopolysaccharide transport system permease protein
MPIGQPETCGSRALYRWKAEVLYQLVLKDFRFQYRGAFLGLVWSLVNPLLLMALYWLLFAGIFRAGITNYPIFVLSGLIPWSFFSSGLSGATNALVAHLPLLRTHRVPLGLFPAAACVTSVLNLTIALGLFGLFRVTQGLPVGPLLWLAPLVLIQLGLTLSLGRSLGTANAVHRDVHQALLFVLRVWFFLTPVVYTVTQVPERALPLVWMNPMAGLVAAYRDVLLAGQAPALVSLAPAVLVGLLGLGAARYMETHWAGDLSELA